MFTNREQKRRWMIAFAALLVTGSLVMAASTFPSFELHELGRGPVIAILWLITPAILIIGSLVGGLLFHAISRLWAAE